METERSFGIIPLRSLQGVWQVFLVQLRRGNHWGFPKGHPNRGESSKESASRELQEETSLKVKTFIVDSPIVEEYVLQRAGKDISKRVDYFLAEVEGVVSLQGEEILDGKWVDLKDAQEKITYQQSQNLCPQILAIVSK